MRETDIIRKGSTPVMQLEERDVPLLTFPQLGSLSGIVHGCTTREGGVSEGFYASLNLKTRLGDKKEAVEENYRRVAGAFGISLRQFVLSDQTHTTNVRKVTKADAGKGIVKKRDYTDVDALVTNEQGLMLSVFSADCVPVFLVDPVHRAIGLAHAGWRGTVGRISAAALLRMRLEYGTDPADLYAAIAPSICQDCYEVSSDVADAFAAEFAGHETEILIDKGNEKYQLDLWQANRIVLEEAGVSPERIEVTDICTCCNPELLFSHRASHGRRGVQGAFLMLQ